MGRRTVYIVLALVLGLLAYRAGEGYAGTLRNLRYREVRGNGPTVVIRGRGCLQAEDSMRLRFVALVTNGDRSMGPEDLVLYRCVQP